MFRRILILCCVIALPAQANDQGLITAVGMGFADGSKMPSPQARLMSKRAATVDAQRALVSTLEGVRITAGTTVKNMMVENDQIGARVQGLLRGAFEVDANTTQEDGSWVAEVTMGVCMTGGPSQCKSKPTLTAAIQPALPKPEPEEVFQPAPAELEAAPAPAAVSDGGVSGLIVDVSGTSFAPQLDVRIRTDEGKELYGPGHVDTGTDWLHWSNSLDNAQSMTDVVGSSPMVVTVETLGRDSELIVSQENAVSIFKNNLESGDFLKQGKVVFIVGG